MPPGSLGQVLQKLGPIDHPDLLAGHRGFEDAGIFRLDGERALVQTVDFFPPMVDDPRWFGRIAAANSLSDVYAMGGRPITAMNLVGWPRDLDLELLGEVLAGGLEKTVEAGAALCGGHSVMDQEIKFGLSVTGLVHPQRFWRNGGAQVGDALILTKPLGIGPATTAIKRDTASPDLIARAMAQMATLNKAACEAVLDLPVHGATDVTGFGFVGHSCEMAEGAGLALAVEAAALPLLDGVLDVVRAGVMSGGCSRGKQHYGPRVAIGAGVDAAVADLVFDAETSGGLLLAVPESAVGKFVQRLRDAGAISQAVVGRFVPHAPGAPVLSLR
ncbi:MAG: selenide, water dikinase SelD [Phycisphaerales bacterium]|nr:selenide, water dikinase SelD [Phycisphaerales bacterium]